MYDVVELIRKMSPRTKRSGRSRKIAFEHYSPICVWCGVAIADLLEVAHIDHKNYNDDPKNLVFLCSTHHRMLDLGLIPGQVVVGLRDNPRTPDWSILIKGEPSNNQKTSGIEKSTSSLENQPESKIEKIMISRRESALKAWATRRTENPKKFGKPTKKDLILFQKTDEHKKKIKSKDYERFQIVRSLAAYKAQRTRKLQNPKKYGKITDSLIRNIRQLEEKLLEKN